MQAQNNLEIPSRYSRDFFPKSQPPLLLLVEDDPSVLKATRRMLEYLGYQVLTANQGEGALAIYELYKARIDLILTDITLPGLNGIELADIIYQKNPHTRIVALTGRAVALSEIEPVSPNIVELVQKPLDLKGLSETVERWLPVNLRSEQH
jgi:CheY-like chemotaxis protein